MPATTIYFLTGLGADERFCERLEIPGYVFKFIAWKPFSKADTLQTYAMKMAQDIPPGKQLIAGLSFGGMLAVEIAKARPEVHAMLISTARTAKDVKWINPINRAIMNWNLIPRKLLGRPNPLAYKVLGATNAEERALIDDINRKCDPDIKISSMKAILNWTNTVVPANTFHVHGTDDKMLMPKRNAPDVWLEGGKHIMIYTRAKEVSAILERYLQSIG